MKALLYSVVLCCLAFGLARAQDLPQDHEQWPPEVFSSAYELIATEDEWGALDALTGPARAEFLERFWVRRDPTPSTPENEFREQFRERVEYVLRWFKTVNIHDPWDDRGRVYIKFGEPDERQDSVDFWYAPMDTAKASRQQAKSARVSNPTERKDPNPHMRDFGEVWYYFGRNLVLQFQGDNLAYQMVPYVSPQGDYQPLFDFAELVHEVDTALPAYVPALGLEVNWLALAWYPFRREDGKYDVYFASVFPVSAFVESEHRGECTLSYFASVTVRDEQMSVVWSDQARTQTQLEGSVRGLSAQNSFRHVLPPGYYYVGEDVRSSDSAHHAAASLEGWLVPYAERVELDLSALVIAARITDAQESGSAFVRNGKQITPAPGAVFSASQTIYFYHEVYNLTPVAGGSCRYRVRYTLYEQKHKTQRQIGEQIFEGTITETFHSGGFPGKSFKKGRYILEAKIDDLVANKTKVALASFKID